MNLIVIFNNKITINFLGMQEILAKLSENDQENETAGKNNSLILFSHLMQQFNAENKEDEEDEETIRNIIKGSNSCFFINIFNFFF